LFADKISTSVLRLGILTAANEELEGKLKNIQQSSTEPETLEKQEVEVKTPLQEEEKRPIPGRIS